MNIIPLIVIIITAIAAVARLYIEHRIPYPFVFTGTNDSLMVMYISIFATIFLYGRIPAFAQYTFAGAAFISMLLTIWDMYRNHIRILDDKIIWRKGDNISEYLHSEISSIRVQNGITSFWTEYRKITIPKISKELTAWLEAEEEEEDDESKQSGKPES